MFTAAANQPACPVLYSVAAPPCHHAHPNPSRGKQNTQISVAEAARPSAFAVFHPGGLRTLCLPARPCDL